MYLGHLALGSRRWCPRAPLAVLLAATVLPDLVDAVLGLLGLEAWAGTATHTLPAAVAWSLATFAAASLRWGARAGRFVGGLTLSHLLADALTSRLELWPEGPTWGLGLYQWRPADFVLEATVIAVAWGFYQRDLPRKPPALAVLVTLLALQAFFDFGLGLS
jgi:hypothetical protein